MRNYRWRTICLAAALCTTALVAAAPSSPVADAAMRGDRDAVKTLLQQGADVNAPHADGMSALHWAAERGDADLASMLLYAGANTAGVTRIGHYTPLHIASKSASLAVVESLLKAGADVNAKTSPTAVTALHLAADSGNAAIVTKLADKGADVNARESEWGQTPLIFAAAQNRAETIRVLLARGADAKIASKSIDLAKQGQLDRAAADRQRRVIAAASVEGKRPTPSQVQAAVEAAREILISGKIPPPDPAEAAAGGRDGRGGGRGGRGGAGADPLNEDGPVSISAKGGLTALLHAARQGHVDAAAALLDGGAPVNQVSAGDATSPLLMAVINGQFDMAMFLVKRGADPNLAAAGNGATPLWASINTQWQPRTRFPQPQQMELQKATYLDVVKALLDAGADPNARLRIHPWYMVYSGCGNRNCGLADTAGSTAFWRAAYGTDIDAMRLLVKYGADPNIATLAPSARAGFGGRGGGQGRGGPQGGGPQGGAPGADGTAPGQAPAGVPDPMPRVSAGSETYVSPLPPVPAGGPGVYAIHAAAGVEYGEGFAGNAHRHAPDGWLPAVKFLVEELGADVNARDNDGYTALHHAAARGDNATILYLISKGADVTAISRRGQTTADMANGPVQRVSPFPETVKLLESLGSKNNHRCVSC